MIIRIAFILNCVITGCAVSQVASHQDGSSNGTGDIMGHIYKTSFLVHPPYHLILFNQNKQFVKLMSEFSFSFDSIPTGDYTLALIDSVKSEGFVNTDTLYDISIETDSISMVAMHFNSKDDHWMPIKIGRKDINNSGSIEGRFNVEEYEKITSCIFEPNSHSAYGSKIGEFARISIKNKFSKLQTYSDSEGYFKLDSIPIGFYEAYASKAANSCLPEKAKNYSENPYHTSFTVINILVLPNKTALLNIDKIDSDDVIVYHFGIDPMMKNEVKWNPNYKNLKK